MPRLDRMRGCFVLLLGLAAAGTVASAQEDMPRRAKTDAPEVEPKLFLNDLEDVLPDADLGPTPTPPPVVDVQRAQAELDRATRKQQRWQQLAKAGVLAKVEAESAVLQVARARVKLGRARAAGQERELETLRQRAATGQITQDAVAAAESALQSAKAMAAEAESGLQRTQLLQAEANLDRQRRLVAAGVGSKNQLKRAEVSLQKLQPPPP